MLTSVLTYSGPKNHSHVGHFHINQLITQSINSKEFQKYQVINFGFLTPSYKINHIIWLRNDQTASQTKRDSTQIVFLLAVVRGLLNR